MRAPLDKGGPGAMGVGGRHAGAASTQSRAGTPRRRGVHCTTQRDEHGACTKEEMPVDVWMVGGGCVLTLL